MTESFELEEDSDRNLRVAVIRNVEILYASQQIERIRKRVDTVVANVQMLERMVLRIWRRKFSQMVVTHSKFFQLLTPEN